MVRPPLRPVTTRRAFLRGLAGTFLTVLHPSTVNFLSRWTELLSEDDPSLVDHDLLHSGSVHGIYVPGWRAVSRKGIDDLLDLTRESVVNTLMIDVKNAWGEVFYQPGDGPFPEVDSQARTGEGRKISLQIDYLMEEAGKMGIRLIARHVMFRDRKLFDSRPELRLWSNGQEHWVDMRRAETIEYNLALLEEESRLGFDEIVLDYIRFPAVREFGRDEDKCEVIDRIVAAASGTVRDPGCTLGVQIFGYAAWHYRNAGGGQRIGTLDGCADVIYPMLYPSHFWPGSLGFEDPSDHPYEIVSEGCRAAVRNTRAGARIIPMVQAFWYSGDEIIQQLKAAFDCGMPGYVCWNPAGRYRNFLIPGEDGGGSA